MTHAPGTPLALNPVSRGASGGRVSDRVSDELCSAIRDLRLEPGVPLSENEVALQLGVSRTPLREAIARLVDRGLLTVVPQVGTRVALIDTHEVAQACFIREALETAAFRLACEAGRRDVGTLRKILERQERAVQEKDGEAFFVTDEDLHREVFRLGGHPEAWEVVLGAKVQLDRLRRLVLPDAVATRDLVAEHTRIVDLLEAGDVEAGVALIGQHSRAAITKGAQARARHPEYFTS